MRIDTLARSVFLLHGVLAHNPQPTSRNVFVRHHPIGLAADTNGTHSPGQASPECGGRAEGLLGLRSMSEDAGRFMCVAALLVAGLLGKLGRRGRVTGCSSAAYPATTRWCGQAWRPCFCCCSLRQSWLGAWAGQGGWVSGCARSRSSMACTRTADLFRLSRRLHVAFIVVVLLLYGLLWMWHYIKRYRLAIGFAALAVGFGHHSLHLSARSGRMERSHAVGSCGRRD